MTTAIPTRPRYAREDVQWQQEDIDALLEAGKATFFTTAKGPIYVVKSDHGSFKVTSDMIVKAAPVVDTVWMTPFDDNAAEAALADQDYYEAQADKLGISVGELTDGEYEDRRVIPAKTSRADRLDALAAKWA